MASTCAQSRAKSNCVRVSSTGPLAGAATLAVFGGSGLVPPGPWQAQSARLKARCTSRYRGIGALSYFCGQAERQLGYVVQSWVDGKGKKSALNSEAQGS